MCWLLRCVESGTRGQTHRLDCVSNVAEHVVKILKFYGYNYLRDLDFATISSISTVSLEPHLVDQKSRAVGKLIGRYDPITRSFARCS